MAIPINIHDESHIPEDRDLSFFPEFKSPHLDPWGGVYAHNLDRNADIIHVQNYSNRPYEIKHKTRLDVLTVCNEEGAYSMTTSQDQMATTQRTGSSRTVQPIK